MMMMLCAVSQTQVYDSASWRRRITRKLTSFGFVSRAIVHARVPSDNLVNIPFKGIIKFVWDPGSALGKVCNFASTAV